MLAVLTALGVSSSSSAQERAVFFQIAGGLTLPLASVRQNFGTGWNLDMGFVFPLSKATELQIDVLHARVGDRSSPVDELDAPLRADQLAISASHFMDAGSASLRFTPPRQSGRLKAYAVAGVGLYYRKVTLSSNGAGQVSVCNPWWFVCPGEPVTLDRVVGRRNSVGLGASIGGGISFVVNGELTAFIEARFHHILSGPAYTLPAGGSRRATGDYLPLSIGLRF